MKSYHMAVMWAEQDNNRQANMDGQPGLMLHKEPRAIQECWDQENSVLQERAHQLFLQYQVTSPENIHTSNILQTRWAVLMYLETSVCVYIAGATTNEIRGHEFESKQGRVYMRVWR